MDPVTMQLALGAAGKLLGDKGGSPAGGGGSSSTQQADMRSRSGDAYSGNSGTAPLISGGSGGSMWGWVAAGILGGFLVATMRKRKR